MSGTGTSDKESSGGNLKISFDEFCKDLEYPRFKENLTQSEISTGQFLEELAENRAYAESFILENHNSESTIHSEPSQHAITDSVNQSIAKSSVTIDLTRNS